MDKYIQLLASKFPWYEITDIENNLITHIVRCDIVLIIGDCRIVPFELKSDTYPDCRIFDCFYDWTDPPSTKLNHAIYENSKKDIHGIEYSLRSDEYILNYTYGTLNSFLDPISFHKFIVVSDKITKNEFLSLKLKNG